MLLKWITRTVITLLVLVVLLAAAVFARSTMIRRRTWDVPATALAVLPTDAAAIAEGGRLARILGCHDCHGEHLEGRLFFSEPHVADLVAPNLSRLVPSYSDAELARAIRHGIRRDGTGLFAMPSASFFHLSDEDLGRLIAHLRRQPRRDGEERVTSIGPIGHVGVATGRFQTVRRDHGPWRHAGGTGAGGEHRRAWPVPRPHRLQRMPRPDLRRWPRGQGAAAAHRGRVPG